MNWKSTFMTAGMMLLAGCGNGEQAAREDTADIAVSGVTGGGAKAPENLPSFAPVYPGATVTMTTLAAQEPDKGAMTLAVPSTDQAAIIAFYRQKAEVAGLKSAMEMATGEAQIIAMNDDGATDGDTSRGLQVTVAPDGEGGSIVSIVYAGGERN